MNFSRRRFIKKLLGLTSSFLIFNTLNNKLLAWSEYSKFKFTQIIYEGGNWNPRPTAARKLMWELIKRTNIDADISNNSLKITDKNLFYNPFLYMAGDDEFKPFSDKERETLYKFLNFGGFLLIDDCSGKASSKFDSSIQRELNEIFPKDSLKRILPDHTIFQSFYLLNRVSGRVLVEPYLKGIDISDRTAVVYSQNDLSGAWAKDNYGNWLYEVTPGGETQREMAIRLGINIIMYSLTLDYKKDQVHLPAILKRRK